MIRVSKRDASVCVGILALHRFRQWQIFEFLYCFVSFSFYISLVFERLVKFAKRTESIMKPYRDLTKHSKMTQSFSKTHRDVTEN